MFVTSHVTGGSMVTFPSGQDHVQGYLAAPSGKGPFPALILIHEWWGLNDQVKATADRLAKEGYVALAVDLYRGKSTADPEVAHQYMAGLPDDRAVRDLLAAFSHLQEQADVRRDRIGSIGWCMGGKFSAQLAVHEPKLAACAIYYGSVPTDPATLKKIQAPVIGFFGGNDKAITPEMADGFEQEMKKLGKKVSVTIYPGAGHAFANETGKNYDEAAAKDSWSRMMHFMQDHLGIRG
jgi:carboxymethylenebutenolidase